MVDRSSNAAAIPTRSSYFCWADLAVLGVAIVWGASYPIAKIGLDYAPVLVLIFLRFAITSIVMTFLSWRDIISLTQQNAARAIILGAVLFLIFAAETYGVSQTSATNTALIISLCVVFTPLLDYGLSRQFPPLGILLCTLVSCAGVAFLTGGISNFGFGDFLVLCAAMLRAVMVVSTKRLFLGRTISTAALTSLQSITVTILALALLLAQTGPSAFAFHTDSTFWFAVLFLSVFCTIGAFFVQNAAVRRSTPTRVSLLMGTEPLFGFALAFLLLSEAVTTAGIIGAVLIVAGTFSGIIFESRSKT